MSAACWTCRVRRKKCDRVHPACTSCLKLCIDCDYSPNKPEWMDGAEKQAEMVQRMKAQIKQGAATTENGTFAIQVFSLRGNRHLRSQSTESKAVRAPAASTPNLDDLTAPAIDDFLTSIYFDTIFPCLFPWYHPQTLGGGRSWLLTTIKTNQAVFHAILSLSAYYFTLLLARDAAHTLRTPCEQQVWDTCAKHREMSMQLIRQGLSEMDAGQAQADIFHANRVLGGMVQLLIFEASMLKTMDWGFHLTAALSQLDGIFHTYGSRNGTNHLHSVLLSMQTPTIFDGTYLGFHVWSAAQTSFQFCTAVLLYADIVSSVSLRAAPRLQHCQHSLIGRDAAAHAVDGEQIMQMENYFGCYGWALIFIGDIAALDEWKLEAISSGASDLAHQLSGRGRELEIKLREGLESIGPAIELYELPSRTDQVQQHILVTKLWLHAGLVYLSIVVHGLQPTKDNMRPNVRSALRIIDILTSHLRLRCPMLPLCITACFAVGNERQQFRRIMADLPPLETFGVNQEVTGSVERAWKCADTADTPWELADCFGTQGSHILLL